MSKARSGKKGGRRDSSVRRLGRAVIQLAQAQAEADAAAEHRPEVPRAADGERKQGGSS